jgi:heme-degrading monooxygenase HmoA
MYARNTYAVGDPAEIDIALEGLRTEAPKLLADCPGFRSFGLFADRDLGKIAMGSFWDTEADRANSDKHLGERRAELLQPFADSVAIQNYEIAALASSPELEAARYFRMGRFEIDPARIDELVGLFKDNGLPRLQDFPGFCGAAMFVDRELGRGAVCTLFADRAALVASRRPQSGARREAAQRTGLRAICLEEFDVVLLEDNPETEH